MWMEQWEMRMTCHGVRLWCRPCRKQGYLQVPLSVYICLDGNLMLYPLLEEHCTFFRRVWIFLHGWRMLRRFVLEAVLDLHEWWRLHAGLQIRFVSRKVIGWWVQQNVAKKSLTITLLPNRVESSRHRDQVHAQGKTEWIEVYNQDGWLWKP